MAARGLRATRWLALGIVLVMVLPGIASNHPSPASASHNGKIGTDADIEATSNFVPAYTTTDIPLTVNRSSVNLSSQFFGTTVTNEVRMFRGETDAVNATPARVLVWPGAMAGEDYDPFTDTHYNTYNGTPTHALTNESQFIQMCEAIHCTAIMQVPAEIDDPSIAEEIVNYTEVNLSFTPAYWMIGNEPELWSHWQVPWKDWASSYYTSGPDPTEFGQEVVQYVKAIRAVDNTTPILGLPASGCTCGYYTFEQWISGVLAVTGNQIQAVAFHEYPAGWLGTGNGSLEDFYGTIQGAASIPTRVAGARQAVESACPKCNVTVFISELGAALSWSAYGQYSWGFSGDLSLASQITQAMDVNLTNIDLFATSLATTNSWFGTTGNPRPDYGLYTSILDHLGSQAFSVNLTGLGRSIYGIDTIAPNDGGRRDLLVVNDNISRAIQFSPRFAESPLSSPVEAWSWNGSIHYTRSNFTGWVEPYTPTPIPTALPDGLPGNYTLPPQSMVLFETYPAAASYVRVVPSGLPAHTPWYVSVGGQFYTTTASNLSLLLPAGAYRIGSVAIPLPIGGKELTPTEQLAPQFASPAYVSGPYTNLSLDYIVQWQVNVTASPGDGGTATPEVGWWDDNESLNLTAAPAVGYAFEGWSGWGPGSYNGSDRSVTIFPTGRITEKARFAVGVQVDLLEEGLPPNTPWSLSIRGFSSSANTSLLTAYELPGSYGFTVDPIVGYRSIPENGGFTVGSTLQLVKIQFIALTPPPPAYIVTFQITGLPLATPVSITVRGDTQSTGGTGSLFSPTFDLINGSYAYQVGYVPGYHPDVPEKTFGVLGGAMAIVVPFVPTVYHVTWEANGTRSGLNWTVVLNGTPSEAASAWLTASLPNGSYPYVIDLPANYSTSPRTGVLVVSGSSMQVYLLFDLVEFPMMFEPAGSSVPGGWSVRLGNQTAAATTDGPSFMAANGTYTFDVHAPSGYFAVPSHGTLTVAGPVSPIRIVFQPSSEQPSAALVAALTSGAVSTSLWIGASVVVGFAALRGLRRRDG